MNSAGLLTVVFMLTLKTEVAAKDACSLTSDGTDMCQPASNTGKYNLASSNAQHVRDGSCDFGQGPCGYTQGCRQGMAPQWNYSAQGYFEMRATMNGSFGQISVLESPVLDVTKPSCLSFTAFRVRPVRLAVVLSTAHTNCTLLANQTHPEDGNRSFAADLPLGVAKIMFQGFHGGDNIHYARIYNVFVEAGCCQDPAWSSVMNDEGINPDHPHCSWTITGMTITSYFGGRYRGTIQ
ncbi:uncharacterized protein [Littorina saxatilis]|uniref:uncharacterized protein n=1 Tax=Littorina saxatilis TaxID=31220 RepID=UPI0038B45E36